MRTHEARGDGVRPRRGPAPRRVAERVLGILLGTGVALLAVVVLGTLTGAWRLVPVRTGSMEPGVPRGSVVVARPVAVTSVAVGDVILFHAPTPDRPLTVHRVVGVEADDGTGEPLFETRGDANDGKDPWLARMDGDRVWRATLVVPYLGHNLAIMRSPQVRITTLLAAVGLLLVLGLRRVWGTPSAGPGAPVDDLLPRRRVRARAGRGAGTSLPARAVVVALVASGLLLGGSSALALFTHTPGPVQTTYSTGTLLDPSPLACRWAGASDVQLDWANTSPTFADGYVLQRADVAGGPYATIGTLAGAGSTTGHDLAPGPPTPRYYVVRATRGTWTGPASNEVGSLDCAGGVATFAGTGSGGYSGDGGPATAARLDDPEGVAVDPAGNVYVADAKNHVVRRVDGSGTITTVAGTGSKGYSGDGGPATAAKLRTPGGVAWDPGTGSLLIADTGNHVVRRVDGSGTITTVAGTGSKGSSGDGGPATAAELESPEGVAVDPAGDVYVADSKNHVVRRVDGSGTITTVAGTGSKGYSGDGGPATAAELRTPRGVAWDPGTGSLLIADTGNHVVRRVDGSGTITTVAGTGSKGSSGDGGPATAAALDSPEGLHADETGNVFVADTGNRRIRRIDGSGTVTTVAGSGANGWSGDGGGALVAALGSPADVALLGDHLLVVQASHHVVRRVAGPL